MKFKQFLKRYYTNLPEKDLEVIVIRLSVFSLLSLIFATLFLISTAQVVNDLNQKENIYSDQTISQVSDYFDYYSNLEVEIPIFTYIYFGLALFFLSYWVDHLFLLYLKYRKLKRGVN